MARARIVDCSFRHRFFSGQGDDFRVFQKKGESDREACVRGLKMRRRIPEAFDLIRARQIEGIMGKKLGAIMSDNLANAREHGHANCQRYAKGREAVRVCSYAVNAALDRLSHLERVIEIPPQFNGLESKKRRR